METHPKSVALAGFRPDGLHLPPNGAPLRVAFVGQRTYFELCSQRSPSPVIEPTFVEFRSGASHSNLLATLRATDPHVVVVFRPELIDQGLFRELRALTLGILTEPLPRVGDPAHPDLVRRLGDLAAVHADEFDRIISFDPLMADTASRYAPVWRSLPLPVSDEVFGWNPSMASPPRMLFVGRTTKHREEYLAPLKHIHDLLHIEHGVFGDEFIRIARESCDIAINIHNEAYPSFENRVSLHLAAGHLVISEPLSPSHGLEPGIDFLEIRNPEELMDTVNRVLRHPAATDLTRWRGRLKAESFRASAVWARVLHDLLADVSVFGGRPR
ncbi:MAG: hypothetical protein U0Q22_05400 [Acidimicrobiales bacterium]